MSVQRIWILSTLSLLMMACQNFDRHPESGYNARLNPTQVKRVNRSELSANEPVKIDTRTRLKQLENQIQTKKELEQYSRSLPYLNGDNERIFFLSIPSYEARQQWIRDENLFSRNQAINGTYRELVDAQDIALGMSQTMVKKSWGEPDNVEVSGNPAFRNERWHYNRYISTPDGYKSEKKVVFFEGGRVVGWDLE